MSFIETEVVGGGRLRSVEFPKEKKKSYTPVKLNTEEENLKILKDARELVRKLECELEVFQAPVWDVAATWEMMSADELRPGDGVQVNNIVCIMVKRLAWWRSKTANILVHEHHNSAKYYRIGSIDYVFGFKGYVNSQRLSKYGMDGL